MRRAEGGARESVAAAEIGDVVGPLEVGPVAHGGHWVARGDDGRVIFVRGALSGETVRVRLNAVASKHAFGSVVEVVTSSPDRVQPPCPIADECGGCDFQHVAAAAQADLKRSVVAEQLRRLAGIDWDGQVEAVAPLLGWRTRVRYHRAADRGSGVEQPWGMHPYRSTEVTPLPQDGCLIAAAGLQRPPADLPGGEVRGVASADAVQWLAPDAKPVVRQHAVGRDWEVSGDGFWQVHPRAADVLASAVLDALDPQPGEKALDLYCGVGLFSGALSSRGVRVLGIEGNRAAVEFARRNVPEATFRAGPVDRELRRASGRVDLVVLDPPRAGAGRTVMDAVLTRRPRAIAYVACDPAALARDLGYARAAGWEVVQVRAFDLFGMTHHVECVALVRPAAGDGAP